MTSAAGSVLRRILIPGLVLQSVIIGGGYATGREFIEFFLSNGPAGGALAMAVATLLISLVYATSLEFARVHGAFEYRSFFESLLGRGWVVFEVLFLALSILVLSVVAATAGTVLHDTIRVPTIWGTLAFVVVTAVVTAGGANVLERFMATSAVVLIVFYATFVVIVLNKFGDLALVEWGSSASAEVASASLDGARYAGYNLASIAATLFCARSLLSRNESLLAGVLGGVLAMAPGALFFFAMLAFMPEVLNEPAPITLLLRATELPIFAIGFMIVLLTTLVATAAGFLHSLNDRLLSLATVDTSSRAPIARGLLSGALLVLAAFVAGAVGMVDLIGQGYGLITFGFLAVFVAPILTVGWWRISQKTRRLKGFGP